MFPVFWFLPIASCPVTGHHWAEPGSVFFSLPAPRPWHLYTLITNPRGFSTPGWAVPALSAPPCIQAVQPNCLHGHSVDSLQYWCQYPALRSSDWFQLDLCHWRHYFEAKVQSAISLTWSVFHQFVYKDVSRNCAKSSTDIYVNTIHYFLAITKPSSCLVNREMCKVFKHMRDGCSHSTHWFD